MTKKWSSTASMDGKTKRQASKDIRRAGKSDTMRAAAELSSLPQRREWPHRESGLGGGSHDDVIK